MTTARVINIIRDELTHHRLPHNVPHVTEDSTFERDLQCDPIDMICILNAVEEAFFDLPDVEVETVGDLAGLIASRKAA